MDGIFDSIIFAGLISLLQIFKVNNCVTFILKYVPWSSSLLVNYEKKSKSHLNFIQKMYF